MGIWNSMGGMAQQAGTEEMDNIKERWNNRATKQRGGGGGVMPSDGSANTGSGMKRADDQLAQAKQRRISRSSSGR